MAVIRESANRSLGCMSRLYSRIALANVVRESIAMIKREASRGDCAWLASRHMVCHAAVSYGSGMGCAWSHSTHSRMRGSSVHGSGLWDSRRSRLMA